MTTTTIKNKVHSLVTDHLQKEVVKRSEMFNAGKVKSYSLTEINKRIKQKLSG